MTSIDDAALQRLCDVARAAGREIMRHYGTTAAWRQKADASPVSIADVAAQRVIVEALTAWDPTIPIVAEESTLPPATLRATWRRYWLVDPLDGTKEFLARNGEFTVNIALIDERAPVLGVVLAPAFDLTYCAGRGLGAWRQGGASRPERISSGRWRAGAAGTRGGEPITSLAGARGLPRVHTGDRARAPGELAEVLSGRRGHRRFVPEVRPDDGMGCCGRGLRLPQLRSRGRTPVAAPLQQHGSARSRVRSRIRCHSRDAGGEPA